MRAVQTAALTFNGNCLEMVTVEASVIEMAPVRLPVPASRLVTGTDSVALAP